MTTPSIPQPGFVGTFTAAQLATMNPANYALQTAFVYTGTVAPYGYFVESDGTQWLDRVTATAAGTPQAGGAPLSVGGATTTVSSSRALTALDNGNTLEVTADGVSLTMPAGLPANFGVAVIPFGTTSIVSSGGTLLNGATTTLVRLASLNSMFAITARASASNSYVVTENTARDKLAANRTYYVRTDGSDSNTGLVNSSSGAFLTVQGALNAVAKIDFNAFVVTIQIADGTYTGAFIIPATVGQKLDGDLIIQGNVTTPTNVILQQASGFQPVLAASSPVQRCRIVGVRLTCSSSNGYGMRVGGGAVVEYGNVDFGANLFIHILAEKSGLVRLISSYTISGGGFNHWDAENGGLIDATFGVTITTSNTPAFTNAFAAASFQGLLMCPNQTFAGTGATGKRYSAENFSNITTLGAGATYLPGNASGTSATGAYS